MVACRFFPIKKLIYLYMEILRKMLTVKCYYFLVVIAVALMMVVVVGLVKETVGKEAVGLGNVSLLVVVAKVVAVL